MMLIAIVVSSMSCIIVDVLGWCCCSSAISNDTDFALALLSTLLASRDIASVVVDVADGLLAKG